MQEKDKPVYWDDKRKMFYWIEWEETGNNDIPHYHYIHSDNQVDMGKRKRRNDPIDDLLNNPFAPSSCGPMKKEFAPTVDKYYSRSWIDPSELMDEIDILPKNSLIYKFFFNGLILGNLKDRQSFKAFIKKYCAEKEPEKNEEKNDQ